REECSTAGRGGAARLDAQQKKEAKTIPDGTEKTTHARPYMQLSPAWHGRCLVLALARLGPCKSRYLRFRGGAQCFRELTLWQLSARSASRYRPITLALVSGKGSPTI